MYTHTHTYTHTDISKCIGKSARIRYLDLSKLYSRL